MPLDFLQYKMEREGGQVHTHIRGETAQGVHKDHYYKPQATCHSGCITGTDCDH